MAFKIKVLNIIFCFFGFVLTSGAHAQGDFAPYGQPEKIKVKEKRKVKPKDAGQSGTVKVDGSAVYEVPNFDSPVIEYMDRGKKIKMSKKIYPGIGGLGAFYKVRVRKGVYGYIADTDAEVSNKKSTDKDKNDDDDEDDQKLEEGSDPTQLQSAMYGSDEPEDTGNSFYMTRYVGFVYSSFNYVEVLRNRSEVAQTTMLGAKISGPMGVMGGMPLDVNVMFTTTAPDFYSKIANSTSGFMLIGDALITLPLYETKSFLLYYGFGAMLRYSSWDVKLKNQVGRPAIDSQEVGIGAAVTAGAALRLGQRLAIRADGRYYYENEKYFGYGAALQFKY